MAYKENQTIELEHDGLNLSVECDIDWNGRPSNSDVYIGAINGLPQFYFEKSFIDKVERSVLEHKYNYKKSVLEFQGEELGDESRGN